MKDRQYRCDHCDQMAYFDGSICTKCDWWTPKSFERAHGDFLKNLAIETHGKLCKRVGREFGTKKLKKTQQRFIEEFTEIDGMGLMALILEDLSE